MSFKRSVDNGKNTPSKKLRIREYVPVKAKNNEHDNFIIESGEKKKGSHGKWTESKELILLQTYAKICPPSKKRGEVSDAWKEVVAKVNSVAPDDVPLGYDACRRNVERLVNIYKQSFEETDLSTLDTCKYKKVTLKEAAFTILKMRQKHKSKEDTHTAKEYDEQETVNVKEQEIVCENQKEESDNSPCEITSSDNKSVNPQDSQDKDFWNKHLQSQELMCTLLKSIEESTKSTAESLKKIERHLTLRKEL